MSKSQVNFRLPDALITALRERAEAEGRTTTEIAVSLLETGLGLSSASTSEVRIASIEERIAGRLMPVIEQRIEQRIEVAIQKEFIA